jgi:hypothetical protein
VVIALGGDLGFPNTMMNPFLQERFEPLCELLYEDVSLHNWNFAMMEEFSRQCILFCLRLVTFCV